MVTNDVRPLARPGAGPVYAALVTPKGKLLHDLFVFRCGGGGGGEEEEASASGRADAPAGGAAAARADPPRALWLDVDAAGAAAVLQWLARYKLRRPIGLEAAGGDASVWARHPGGGGGGSSGGGGWFEDPRLPGCLGERGVFEPRPPAGGGGWREAGEAAHRRLRYRLGVAEGDAEMPTGGCGGPRQGRAVNSGLCLRPWGSAWLGAARTSQRRPRPRALRFEDP
jgi:hypothetical protein